MIVDALELQRRVDRIDGFYRALKDREESLKEEVKNLKLDIEELTKTSTVLKYLLDTMVKDEINNMANLVTYGLKTVFKDQNLTFIPVITKKSEKIHIELKTGKNGGVCEFGSFGGSVAVVESFLLRLLCILKKKYARLILLDETFAAIGEEYIGATSALISELSKKLGLDVLLVTHQKGFKENADHVFLVKESNKGLAMESLK
jgi:DNA repair exonuclease SbcCD ATPase subunit